MIDLSEFASRGGRHFDIKTRFSNKEVLDSIGAMQGFNKYVYSVYSASIVSYGSSNDIINMFFGNSDFSYDNYYNLTGRIGSSNRYGYSFYYLKNSLLFFDLYYHHKKTSKFYTNFPNYPTKIYSMQLPVYQNIFLRKNFLLENYYYGISNLNDYSNTDSYSIYKKYIYHYFLDYNNFYGSSLILVGSQQFKRLTTSFEEVSKDYVKIIKSIKIDNIDSYPISLYGFPTNFYSDLYKTISNSSIHVIKLSENGEFISEIIIYTSSFIDPYGINIGSPSYRRSVEINLEEPIILYPWNFLAFKFIDDNFSYYNWFYLGSSFSRVINSIFNLKLFDIIFELNVQSL